MVKKLLLLIICCLLFLHFTSFNTKEVIVAVIDTGLDKSSLENINRLPGYDFIDLDTNPNDENGHGTLMAKIISDVAPYSTILPVRFLEKNKDYTIYRPFAIFYSIIKGADIINMSFNGDSDFLTDLMIKYGNSKGVIFVGAAGNSGKNEVDYPAKYNGVLAIGGYDLEQKNYYGNYSSDIDFIASATHENIAMNRKEIGTSISAAYISGIIAFLKEEFPDVSNEEIFSYLYNHAAIIKKDDYSFSFIDTNKIKAIIDNDVYFSRTESSIYQNKESLYIPVELKNVNN